MGPAYPVAGNPAWGIGLLVGVTLAAGLALVLVFVAKARRDRAERRSRELRAGLLECLQGLDAARLRTLTAAMSRQHLNDQADLLAVLSRPDVHEWWTDRTTELLHEALGGAEFIAVLVRQLSSRKAAKRGTALLLGSSPSCRVPDFLIARAMGDEDSTVRLTAAAALEREETLEAANVLLDALEAHALPDARIVERLGHEWAVEACRSRLRACDPLHTGTARGSMARALGLAGDPVAITDLLWLLDIGSTEEAVQAMRSLASCSVAGTEQQRSWIAAAARTHVSSDADALVLMATEAISVTGDDGDIPLLASLVSHPDWHVRRAAARALGRRGAAGLASLSDIVSGTDRYAADRASEELAMITGGPDGR